MLLFGGEALLDLHCEGKAAARRARLAQQICRNRSGSLPHDPIYAYNYVLCMPGFCNVQSSDKDPEVEFCVCYSGHV